MEKDWVDFRAVKAAISMQMILDHYGLAGLKKVGQELRGKCPIHAGSSNAKHFSVNVSKNAFKCFFVPCAASGNVLDFVAAMEQCSIRDAGLKLKDWFQIGDTEQMTDNEYAQTDSAPELTRGIYRDQAGALYEVITSAANAEDSEPLVVYRELFGKYRFWVTPFEAFSATEESPQTSFTLVQKL
jgi:hypothetical protein